MDLFHINRAEALAHKLVTELNAADLDAIREKDGKLHLLLKEELRKALELRDRINAIKQAL